jgi:hypothetical protein
MVMVGLAPTSDTLLKGLVEETLENMRKVTLSRMFSTWNLNHKMGGLIDVNGTLNEVK